MRGTPPLGKGQQARQLRALAATLALLTAVFFALLYISPAAFPTPGLRPMHSVRLASARLPPAAAAAAAVDEEAEGAPGGSILESAYACSAAPLGGKMESSMEDTVAASAQLLHPPCSAAPSAALLDAIVADFNTSAACAAGRVPDLRATTVRWPVRGLLRGEGQAPGCMALGYRHTLTVSARTDAGALCQAGAYFEARLEGQAVRYRPRFTDLGGGRFRLSLQLPDDALLEGALAVLEVRMLFTWWGGLTLTDWWPYNRPDTVLLREQLVLVRGLGSCSSSSSSSSTGSSSGSSSSSSSSSLPPPLLLPAPTQSCTQVDFMAVPFWEGHWLRLPEAPGQGVPEGSGAPASACPPGACSGDASVLWSRWVYRLPTCYFHLFDAADARVCLHGTHLWGSGDSNFADLQRALLAHVLALDVEGWLVPGDFVFTRSNDQSGARPAPRQYYASQEGVLPLWPAEGLAWAAQWPGSSSNGTPAAFPAGQWVVGPPAAGSWQAALSLPRPRAVAPHGRFNMSFRTGNLFNGGSEDRFNHDGVTVAESQGWVSRHAGTWEGFARYGGQRGVLPTVLAVNSGLHDGVHWGGGRVAPGLDVLHRYHLASRRMQAHWRGLRAASTVANAHGQGLCHPRLLWLHTNAPGGAARTMPANPQKMELFNRLMAGDLIEGELAEGAWLGRGKNGSSSSGGGGGGGAAAGRVPGCPSALHTAAPRLDFLDAFDMTFPFHWDSVHNNGGHYGVSTCEGAQYGRCDAVALMIVHVLLNGLCEA